MLSRTDELSERLSEWARQLKADPKSRERFAIAPYGELVPVYEALSGLGTEIEKLEEKARTDGKISILRGIAHDILNPVMQLNRTFGAFELTARDGDDTDMIREMRASLTRLSGVAMQAKLIRETEINQIPPSRVDLAAEVETSIKYLKHDDVIAKKGVRLKLVSTQHGVCLAESVDVQRILENLVRNSAHASKPGQIIEVAVSTDDSGCVLSVRDSGCGMSEETKRRAFESEFTTRPGCGSGLGLSVVQSLCEKHEAKIEFQSQLGHGTEFRVRFRSA